MTDTEALKKLEPHIEVCSQAWHQSLVDVRTEFFHPEHDQRCRSTLLQNHAVIHAKRDLINSLGATYKPRHTQHIFTIPNIACIVFKQLDPSLKPRVTKTTHAKKFYSQEGLIGLELIPRLICGAVPADDFSELVGIYLVHPHSNGNAYNWALNITTKNPVPVDDIQQDRMTFINDSDEEKPHRKRFRAKKQGKEESQEGQTSV